MKDNFILDKYQLIELSEAIEDLESIFQDLFNDSYYSKNSKRNFIMKKVNDYFYQAEGGKEAIRMAMFASDITGDSYIVATNEKTFFVVRKDLFNKTPGLRFISEYKDGNYTG